MSNKKQKIGVYGFDSIGFEIQDSNLIVTDCAEIQFISIDNPRSLNSFDSIVFPSGIFEEFKSESTYEGKYVEVHCKRDLLLQRERELINLMDKDGWICCLVRKVIDKVPYGVYKEKECDDTDLAKTLLNSFYIERNPFKGSASVVSKNDEFSSYIERWGVAKTILKLSNRNQDRKVLATIEGLVVGVEFSGKVFFLPFHTTIFSKENAESLAKELCRAIHDYAQKRINLIPDWVNEFQFKKEDVLNEKLNNLLLEANTVQQDILQLRSYKGILSQSGDVLKDNVILILRIFFKLNVTNIEDFKEDAIIRDADGKAIVVVEIKGTKGGIKRNYINQLDTNREKNSLSLSIPGLLIINDQMNIENIAERRETTVAEEQIKHAKNMNILIIRTLDLLFLMRNLEQEDNPGKILIGFCYSGGGRLIIDNNSSRVII